jgi:hypothetical protein
MAAGPVELLDPVDPVNPVNPVDPVTREPLARPVVASDGVTYSLETLLAAMRADPYRRSPVTGEVLRPLAFRDRIAEQVVRLGAKPPHHQPKAEAEDTAEFEDTAEPNAVVLYDDAPPADDAAVHDVQLPERFSAALSAVLERVGLDEVGVPIRLRVVTHKRCIMHPPPVEEAWDACLALCDAVLGPGAVLNPWCMGGARVTAPGLARTIATVEDAWRSAWLAAAAAQPPR